MRATLLLYLLSTIYLFGISKGDMDATIFTAFGSKKRVVVEGRLHVAKKQQDVQKSDSSFKNLKRKITNLNTKELKGKTIYLRLADATYVGKSDDEGYFDFDISLKKRLKAGIYEAKILSAKREDIENFRVHIFADSSFGIISDFDDTIIKTGVNSKLKLIKNTLLYNYKQREPVSGMRRKIRSILKREGVPFFIISGSPMQLFDSVKRFLRYWHFPESVVMLKRINGKDHDPLFDQFAYKKAKIERIFEIFPKKRWILFGDDTQKDPQVYETLRKKYPKRVIQINIREVK